MKKILLSIFKTISKPLLGRGILNTYFPLLNKFVQKIYSDLQTEKYQTVTIPLNLKLKVLTKDACLGIYLLMGKSYEPQTTELFLKNIKTFSKIVDIGANVGYYTLLAAKKCTKGIVYAFEPDLENFNLLKENIKINNLKNVVIENKAISNKNGFSNFLIANIHKGKSRLLKKDYPNINQARVRTIKLDSYFKNVKIDLIKMDIEGAEILALLGAKRLIRYQKKLTIILEYNPQHISEYGYEPKQLIDLIESLDLKIYKIIDESQGKVIDYTSQRLKEVLKHTNYCNFLCYKP